MKIQIKLLAALLLAAIPTLSAEEKSKSKPEKSPQEAFEKMDTDKNGSLNKAEFSAKTKDPAKAEKKFAKADTNKDGTISLEEFTAAGNKKKDPNKDKKESKDQ
jgi:Ca2+-binding EF-hand superfamily protein